MSRHHAWLTFVSGGARLPHRLLPADDDAPTRWQRALQAQHRHWYGRDAAPQVAAAFVLQWLLQVPAHTAAHAAAAGPWRASLSGVTYSIGAGLVPDRVRLEGLRHDPSDLAERMAGAERDYRAVAIPLAEAYRATSRIGPHARAAFVDDMWAAAAREAEGAAGRVRLGSPQRGSCCLIYALPGCVECAGCPRVRRATHELPSDR